ncbi:MAG TPA: hypothetical protein VHP58_04645 [Alphaproteobacteria bacterium]|nr:hypothetical protein [Alphaproteobacteria bacterium]
MPTMQELAQALMALPCSGYDPAPAFAPTVNVEADRCRATTLLPPNFGGRTPRVMDDEPAVPVFLFRYTS